MRGQYANALPLRVAMRVNEEASELEMESILQDLQLSPSHDEPLAASASAQVASAVQQMFSAGPHDDALTNVGALHRVADSSRSSMSLAQMIEHFDLDALLADESSLLQAQLEEEEEYHETDDPSVTVNLDEPPHKLPPPPPPSQLDDNRAVFVEDLPDDDHDHHAHDDRGDSVALAPAAESPVGSLPSSTAELPTLPPTPVWVADEIKARQSVAIAPAEPPEDVGAPPLSPRARLPPPPSSPSPSLAVADVLPPPPVPPPEGESVRAPPEPESTRPSLSGSFGLSDLDASSAQRSRPPVPKSAPPAKAAERSRSPGRSAKDAASKKTKSPERRAKKERAVCDNCKERKASHRATLVTGQVIKLCAVCTDRARDAKRAAEQRQAALAAAAASAPATLPAPAAGSASPTARKRERGMRYLEKVFPNHDKLVLSKALDRHRLDFVSAGEALQREQASVGAPPVPFQPQAPAVPPAPRFSPAPDISAPVPPPVPPWESPAAPSAPPTRLPSRERRATLREQFLLSDFGGPKPADRSGEVSRVAELRLRLADEQRVRAEQRQLRDAIVAKLERVRTQRNRLRDRLDSVARQVRFMQEDELPQRDIERAKDQKRQLVRKLLELDEKNNKYVGMLRRVDADRARNDAVRSALQDEIAQLTVELERRAADVERATPTGAAATMGAMPSGRRESLRLAVEQLRTLSTLKVDKDGLVVVPTTAAAASGMPLPPPRRGPLPVLVAQPSQSLPRAGSSGGGGGGGASGRAVEPPAVLLASTTMPALPPPTAVPAGPPAGRPPLANRLPLRSAGRDAPMRGPSRFGGPGSAHLAVAADEQLSRDSQGRPRSNSDADVAPPQARVSVVASAARAPHPLATSLQQRVPPRAQAASPPPPPRRGGRSSRRCRRSRRRSAC